MTPAARDVACCVLAVAAGAVCKAFGVDAPDNGMLGVLASSALGPLVNVLTGPIGSHLSQQCAGIGQDAERAQNHDLRRVLTTATERACAHLRIELFGGDGQAEERALPVRSLSLELTALTTSQCAEWIRMAGEELVRDDPSMDAGGIVTHLSGTSRLNDRVCTYLLNRLPATWDEACKLEARRLTPILSGRFAELLLGYVLQELKPGTGSADNARWLIEQAYLDGVGRHLTDLRREVRVVRTITRDLWSPELKAAWNRVCELCQKEKALRSRAALFLALLSVEDGVLRQCLDHLAGLTSNGLAVRERIWVRAFELTCGSRPPEGVAPTETPSLQRAIKRAQELLVAWPENQEIPWWAPEHCMLKALVELDGDGGTVGNIVKAAGLTVQQLGSALEGYPWATDRRPVATAV
jgi:hypothetical protein